MNGNLAAEAATTRLTAADRLDVVEPVSVVSGAGAAARIPVALSLDRSLADNGSAYSSLAKAGMAAPH
jgi:hypothetical protein